MSRVVRPDPRRLIHLDGVGDVSRPVEVGGDVSGLAHLSMRTYDFLDGQVIDGEAETDEVAIVLVSGRATLQVAGDGVDEAYLLAGRDDPFEAPAHAVYLPPHHRYRLRLERDSTVSYSRSTASGARAPFHADPSNIGTEEVDEGVTRRVILGAGAAEHITVEEWIVPAGSWYPTPGARFEGEEGEPLDLLLHIVLQDAQESVIAVTNDDDRPWLLHHRDTLAVAGNAFGFAVPPSTDAAILCIAAGRGASRHVRLSEPALAPGP